MKIKNIIFIFIALVISFFAVNFENMVTKTNDKDLVYGYKVYIDGKDIGLINDREELNKYINEKQEEIRKKYLVDNVYVPNNIDVVKDLTYSNEIEKVADIYDKIQENNPFTIEGYEITIDRTDSASVVNDNSKDERDKIIKIYTLEKETFTEAVNSALFSFIDSKDYEDFINENTKQLDGVGEMVEDVYIDDNIKIKKTYVPVTNKIYMEENDLAKYLLFADNEVSQYIVKETDTLETIANNNRMSVNELVIANDSIKDSNSLLFTGQNVKVGAINPLITVVVEKEVVDDQVIKYQTETKYDSSLYQGYYYVSQNGSNGEMRVTSKVKYVNGVISNSIIVDHVTLKEAINKIEIKGGRRPPTGDGEWRFPLAYGTFTRCSGYGWRGGEFHLGIDLCSAYGTPIYSSRSGTVVQMGWYAGYGNHVLIDHGNGYYSHYGHMSSFNGDVHVGDYIEGSTCIGYVGSTGNSFGNHLHFEIYDGYPVWSWGQNSSNTLNPDWFLG